MKKPYLFPQKNVSFVLKPTKALRLLMIVCLLANGVVSAANISSAANGYWSSASTWSAVAMTGTITTLTSSKNITGNGTLFLTELAVGSIIKTSGGTTIGTVASITSNTSLTLVVNAIPASYTNISYKAQVVPTSNDNVTISDGTTVTVDVNAVLKSVIVSNGATLSVNDGKTFTVGSDTVLGDFTVNSGGKFSMGSGSDHSTLMVYGNYTNNGETIFWKSDVIIRGNLNSTATSTLQNNGNVIVGGDIIGTFDLNGGTGTGQIYAVNPNATVTISPTSIDNNVNPGTFPSGESPALIDLVNTVIYGGSCSFTINNVANVTACSGSNAVFTVTTTGTSPIYQWQVNKNDGTGWVDLTNVAPYSGVSTASLTITGVTTSMNSYKYRAKITSASCSKSGNYGILTVNASPVITTQPISQLDCEGASVNFTVVATGTGLTYLWQYKKPLDLSFTDISSTTTNINNFDKNIITIRNVGSTQFPSGTLYQVVVTNSGGCSVTSSAATLLVNELTGILPTTTTVTQCYGTNYSYTVSTSTPPPGYVVSYQWKSSVTSGVWNPIVDGPHFSGANTATLNIINGTPTESAGYRVYITFHSSGSDCNVSSALIRNITFLPLLLTPSVSVTQPTCITATGTIAITVQSASDTYSFDNGLSYQSSNSKSGLAIGSYNVIIKNSLGCISPTLTVAINSAVKTWNGSISIDWNTSGNWTPAGIPDATNCVIIPNVTNDPIIGGANFTALAYSLTVLNGGSLIVNSTNSLKVTDIVNVNTSGTLTFEDSASLVQTNNVINSGNITYKRYASIRNTDFTYWSSPVYGYTLGGVSQNKTLSDKYYSYNSTADDWKQESAATVMTAGIGYIIRGPEPPSPSPFPPPPPGLYEAPFVGVPNNGDILVNVAFANPLNLLATDSNYGVSYLLGNPYPSAFDAETFLDYNAGVIGGTIYFWTHNTALDLAANITNPDPNWAYAYSLDDYAAYNSVGGVGVGSGSAAVSGGAIPTGKIAAGQGFFATCIANGTVTFKNNMRLAGTTLPDGTGANQQFFKTKNTKNKTAVEKHRIWLDLKNTQGAFKQTLIGYVANATNEFDIRFDGESFDGNEFVDFYSVNNDKNLTIQGRALPFDEKDEVPLGFRTTIVGDFTINIDQTDGLLTNQPVFIEDKLTNTVFDLKSGNYTFSTLAGTFNDRFVLRYTDKTLGVDEVEANDAITVLYSNNYNTLIIHNSLMDATVNSVTLCNMTGQKIANWDVKDREQTNIQIPIKNLPSEIYIVKVKTTKGESSNKIIIK
jgi:hypothetical protein